MRNKILITLIIAVAVIAQTAVNFQTCGAAAIPPSSLQAVIEGWRSAGCNEVHLRYDMPNQVWLGYAVKIDVTPSITVSGAGTSEVNGTYTQRGTHNGRPYYNKASEPDGVDASSIFWDTNDSNWYISGADTSSLYRSTGADDVATPDLVPAWEPVGDGVNPSPTVSAS